jgi:hypothetical protein
VRLRRLSVDIYLSARAGLPSGGPRLEQARDVEPDIQANAVRLGLVIGHVGSDLIVPAL